MGDFVIIDSELINSIYNSIWRIEYGILKILYDLICLKVVILVFPTWQIMNLQLDESFYLNQNILESRKYPNAANICSKLGLTLSLFLKMIISYFSVYLESVQYTKMYLVIFICSEIT